MASVTAGPAQLALMLREGLTAIIGFSGQFGAGNFFKLSADTGADDRVVIH